MPMPPMPIRYTLLICANVWFTIPVLLLIPEQSLKSSLRFPGQLRVSQAGRYYPPARLASLHFRADQVPPELIHLRSEEHTSELQSLMRISYAVFCLKKKKITNTQPQY